MRVIKDIHGIGPVSNAGYSNSLSSSLAKLARGVSTVPHVSEAASWAHVTGEFDSQIRDYAADVLGFFDTNVEAEIMHLFDDNIEPEDVIFAHSMGTIWWARWVCLNMKRRTPKRIPEYVVTAGSPLCNRLFGVIQADLYQVLDKLPRLHWSNFADKFDLVSFNPLNAARVPELLPCFRRLGCKTTMVSNADDPHTGFRNNFTTVARVYAYALS